jgi:membrane-bound metal-dependent hydrolase YbcI (DUF457 family)
MRFYTHIAAGLLLYTLLVWIFALPYSIAGFLVVVFFSVLPDLIDKVTGDHRGWGHSAIWFIPVAALLFINPVLGAAFFSAFSMHILLDSVTKKGVPFLYPFSKTRLVMPKKEKSRIQTGSKQETALCVVILLLLIPLTYFVLAGVPGDWFSSDYAKYNKTGNNSTSKAVSPYSNLRNSTGYSSGYGTGSLGSLLTKNLKNSGSSSSGSSGNKTTSKNSTGSTSTSDDLDQGLLNWLNQDLNNNNNQNNQTNNNQNTTDNTNNNQQQTDEFGNSLTDYLIGDSQPIVDVAGGEADSDEDSASESLFADLRSQFENLVEGVPLESNMTQSDQSLFDYDYSSNPDADEESSITDQLGLML